MPELRWALIGLGVLFIAGLALWEWRRSRRRQAHGAAEIAASGVAPQGGGEPWPRRIEPRIDDLGAGRAHERQFEDTLDGVPVIHPSAAAEVNLRVAPEAAVDVPGAAAHETPEEAAENLMAEAAPEFAPEDMPAAPDLADARQAGDVRDAQDVPARSRETATAVVAIRWPPERADRVLTLRLANAQGALLQGRAVRLALEQAGLVPGPQCIYHRIDAQGCVLASAANMLRPGDLDPVQMDEQQFRGLSLFSVLPGALPPVRMLEELVALARALAWRLGAVVQDDQGVELDGERLVRLRQSLPATTEHGTA